MTPLYALLRGRCGLSLREAAAFHAVRVDSVHSWNSGRNNPKAPVIAELRGLYAQIERAAAEALATLAAAPAAELVELALASDDTEAQSLGWPCVGAQEAMLGLVAARCDRPVRIVPCGSTPATAAAAEVHR